MRVCVVTESHAGVLMGGAEYQTFLLADELSRRPNVDLTYLARRVPTGAEANKYSYRLRSIANDAGFRRRAVFFDAGNLWRALHEIEPDVIYQQAKQSYTAVCARYAEQAKIPFFFHVAHDFDLGHQWITLRLSPNTPFDIAESLSGDWGIRHASHVIVQSERQGKLLQNRTGQTAAMIVRNFQPLPETLPAKPEGPMRIFWVANFKDFKRPGLFVELAESFAGRSDLAFIMAGRPATQRRFAPLMKKIPTVPNLQYLGEIPIEQVNEQMSLASMHVNTSTFEGFPNTFLQAWGRGAVVATLNVDPDERSMEELGVGYRAGSLERLRAFIDDLSRSPDKRRSIAENAFAFVHKMHGLAHGARLADNLIKAAADAMP